MKKRKKEYVITETVKYDYKGDLDERYYRIYQRIYLLWLIPWWKECEVEGPSIYNKFYSLENAQTYLNDVLLTKNPKKNTTEVRVVDKVVI